MYLRDEPLLPLAARALPRLASGTPSWRSTSAPVGETIVTRRKTQPAVLPGREYLSNKSREWQPPYQKVCIFLVEPDLF